MSTQNLKGIGRTASFQYDYYHEQFHNSSVVVIGKDT